MGLYEQIKEVASTKGYSVNRLEKELGFPRSSISKFNKNKPSIEKIQQIADFLQVPLDYLTTGETISAGMIACPDCGFNYCPSYPEDVEEHNKEHFAWMKASEKFGILYCDYSENEKLKAQGRNICHDLSLPLEKRYEAQIQVLRCLFSRSLQANDYNLEHVPFDKYIAMMLGNKTYRKNLDDELYRRLADTYGVSKGIESGSIYRIPFKSFQAIAAHFDGEEFTENQWERIKEFAKFIKSQDDK